MIINDKDKERWWCGISNDITPPTSPIGEAALAAATAAATATTASVTPLQQLSNSHLLELQKEIKEEEDEIFADINSLIANSHTDYDTLPASATLNSYLNNTTITNNNNNNNINNNYNNINIISNISTNNNTTTATNTTSSSSTSSISNTNTTDTSYNIDHQLRHHHHNNDRELYDDHYDEDTNEMHTESYNNYYGHNNYYIDDQDIIDTGLADDVEQLTQNNIDHEHGEEAYANNLEALNLLSSLPKPCVFFLEGNCRRSDCKYSHDLSNITCKYWIEGFCFKGDMCPFLHSYLLPAQDQESLDKDDDERVNEPTFTIESETDFPSLPK